MIHIKKEPLSLSQIIIREIIVTVAILIILDIFKLGYAFGIIGVLGYMIILLYFHYTAPLTEHFSFSKKNKNTLEIHMVFRTLFKIVKPNIKNNAKLIGIFSREFLIAIQYLIDRYPKKLYMTRTWLIPKHYLKILKKCGFNIKYKHRCLIDIITEFFMLLYGNKSIIKSVKTLHKHKNYKITWNKVEGEQLLTFFENHKIK